MPLSLGMNNSFGREVNMSWHRYGKRSRPRKLTDAQLRLLAEVVKTGSKSYNGRISKSLEALEDFGLVESDFYVRSAGGGDALVNAVGKTFTNDPDPKDIPLITAV